MCAPCERVRSGSESATLIRHTGHNRFSDVSAQMRPRQPESVEPVLSPA